MVISDTDPAPTAAAACIMRHGARHRGASFEMIVSCLNSSIPSIHPLAGSQGGGTAAGRAEHIAWGVAPRPSI